MATRSASIQSQIVFEENFKLLIKIFLNENSTGFIMYISGYFLNCSKFRVKSLAVWPTISIWETCELLLNIKEWRISLWWLVPHVNSSHTWMPPPHVSSPCTVAVGTHVCVYCPHHHTWVHRVRCTVYGSCTWLTCMRTAPHHLPKKVTKNRPSTT